MNESAAHNRRAGVLIDPRVLFPCIAGLAYWVLRTGMLCGHENNHRSQYAIKASNQIRNSCSYDVDGHVRAGKAWNMDARY